MSLLAPDAPAGDAGSSPEAAAPPPAAAATPAAAAAPSTYTWADETGKFSSDWLEKLGPDFKGNPTLSTVNNLPGLAKAYLDTKALVGKRPAPPSETSTPEQVAEWRKLVGAPETPDAYGSLMPEGFQKELWNGDIEKAFTEVAHKHHLSPAAVKEIAALQAQGTLATYEREVARAREALDAGRAELKKEWGPNFDRRAAEAKALATAIGIPEDDDIFISRPDILKRLAAAAPALLGPDKLITGAPVGIAGGIQERIETIQRGDDYQGKNGFDKQKAAQAMLHQLMAAAKPAA